MEISEERAGFPQRPSDRWPCVSKRCHGGSLAAGTTGRNGWYNTYNNLKSLLLSLLIVAVLVVLYLRPWVRGGGSTGKSPPTERFLRDCRAVSSDQQHPEAYCRCLWDRGLRSVSETLTRPEGRKSAAACRR